MHDTRTLLVRLAASIEAGVLVRYIHTLTAAPMELIGNPIANSLDSRQKPCGNDKSTVQFAGSNR